MATSKPSEKVVGTAEAAQIIGVSNKRVQQLVKEGTIAATKISERSWMIPVSECERYRDMPKKAGRPRNHEELRMPAAARKTRKPRA